MGSYKRDVVVVITILLILCGCLLFDFTVCLRAAPQYVLLFLAWFNNSDRFQMLHALTLAARSYALLMYTMCI